MIMAALSVTTTPAKVLDSWSDIQNLGPADVYIGNDSGVTSTTGLKLVAGASYSRPGVSNWIDIWAVTASGTADLRILAYPGLLD